MIKIEIIGSGWLNFTIDDGTTKRTFCVSYISDFISLINEILELKNTDFNNQENIRRVFFDGEGKELYITGIRELYGDRLTLIWEEYEDDVIIKIFNLDFDEFKRNFNLEFKKIKREYYKRFDFDMMTALEEELTGKDDNFGNY